MERNLQTIKSQNNLAIWAERVQSCRSSGMSTKEWCAENGIVPNTYFRWQKKVFNAMQPEEGQFYEIPIPYRGGKTAVSIEINGVTANILSGASTETILATLRAMKAC